MTGYKTVKPVTMETRANGDATPRLIDVRNYDEFAVVHVGGAVCHPLPRLLEAATAWSPDEAIHLICQSGQRATEAAQMLSEVGFKRLFVVDGGTQGCIKAGLPVTRGTRRLPIQRQVFVGAGAMILAGLALSNIQPAFVLVSWFAATGLFLAGITGFCPMAKILAFAPWNRSPRRSDRRTPASCSLKGGCS